MTDDLELKVQGEQSPVSDAQVAPDEDMQKPVFNKIQVQDVVNREKQKAYERGKKEALMELQQQTQAAPEQAAQLQPQGQQQGLGGMPQLQQSDIERMIAEKAPQLLQNHINEMKNNQMVDSFVNKMQAAEEKHPGLEAKLNDLDYTSMAPLITMANNMENTGDIMKELLDNPSKMGNLLTLMYTQPKLAQREMMSLSNSIKTNQDAVQADKEARDPMSQLKPSSSAGIDNSAMSVTDFKKMFRG